MKAFPRKLHLPLAGPRWVAPESAQLDLVYLGWGKRRFAQHPIPRSRHPGWVYFLIRRGAPTLRLEGTAIHTTHPGEVIVVGPDCASGWTDTGDGVTDLLTWVWRSPPRCAAPSFSADGFRSFGTSLRLRRTLEAIHDSCRREVEGLDAFVKPALEQQRLAMDVAIARAVQHTVAPPESALRLELALRWLAQNLSEPRPVSALCDYLQVSPATLNRLFQAHLSESPASHHARLKIDRARQLLIEGAAAKEVAYALGYRHPNDFSRAFKKAVGIGAAEFVQQQQSRAKLPA